MIAIIDFLFWFADRILWLLVWAMIISAIMSWLVAFDVINLRNRFAYNVNYVLERITRPILAPFQRFVPLLGGVDVSPIIAILVIVGIRRFLLPAAHQGIINLLA